MPHPVTLGDKYNPAMKITEQADADRYLEQLVLQTMAQGYSRADAETIERFNICYWSAFLDQAVSDRVDRLFKKDAIADHCPALASEPQRAIREALRKYHHTLDRRGHAGVAAGIFVNEVEEILGAPWERGATVTEEVA